MGLDPALFWSPPCLRPWFGANAEAGSARSFACNSAQLESCLRALGPIALAARPASARELQAVAEPESLRLRLSAWIGAAGVVECLDWPAAQGHWHVLMLPSSDGRAVDRLVAEANGVQPCAQGPGPRGLPLCAARRGDRGWRCLASNWLNGLDLEALQEFRRRFGTLARAE